MPSSAVDSQINSAECRLLTDAILAAPTPPKIVLEVGTWLGGGSTFHFLRALEANGEGHLWGIEADQNIYERMLENVRGAVPEAVNRFTPLFGFSEEVIPRWLAQQGPEARVDLAFLDGGDNPAEQIAEFHLLADRIPIGGRLMSHDAKLRKGKWLRPYLTQFDNWQVELHDVSAEGLLSAVKLREQPSAASRRAATRTLWRFRFQPVELIGRILPTWACRIVLGLMPAKLRLRVSQGR